MKRTMFDVPVQRDGDAWKIHVPELGVITRVKEVRRVRYVARELIATTLACDMRAVGAAVRYVKAGTPIAMTHKPPAQNLGVTGIASGEGVGEQH